MNRLTCTGLAAMSLLSLISGTGCGFIWPGNPDSETSTPTEQNTPEPGDGATSPPPSGTKTAISDGFECATEADDVPCSVQRGFYVVRRAGEGLGGLWQGAFDFVTQPLYIVDIPEGESPRGYLINPPSVPDGAEQITGAAAQGTSAYRYDASAGTASKVENGLFDLFFDIDGNDYSVMLTSDQNEGIPSEFRINVESDQWIAIFAHETFHGHQIKNWSDPPGAVQDFENYPLTSETIAIALLEMNIVFAALKTNEPDDHERFLKMYVAARTEGIRVDPSDQQLIRNMANAQEHGEGTARYTEVKMIEVFDPDYPQQYHGSQLEPFLEFDASVAEYAGEVFGFGMWYETGAIVLRMMDTLGINHRDALAEGQTPFDIADTHFGMSDTELAEVLSDAQTEFDWDKLQADAQLYAEVVTPISFGDQTDPTNQPPSDGGDVTQELMDACEGLAVGDVCSAAVFGQGVSGECTMQEPGLLCIPNGTGG